MKKRILALLLAAIMVVSILPMAVFANSQNDDSKVYTWTIHDYFTENFDPIENATAHNLNSEKFYFDGIEVAFTDGDTATRFWKNSGTVDLRIYKNGGSIAFNCPESRRIDKIEFFGKSRMELDPGSTGSYVNPSDKDSTWTAANSNTKSVKFNARGTTVLNKVVITYTALKNAVTNGTPESDSAKNHGYIAIDKTSASEGDTVTVNVNPADGYQLKSLIATPVVQISTIADVLATVEGFPENASDDIPSGAWGNENSCSGFIFSTALTLKGSESKKMILLSTSVTKKENCYTAKASGGNLTFNMTDGVLTSFEFEATGTAPKTYDGTYTPASTPSAKLKPITPAKQTDGTYTFTMPGYPVTVTAEFEEALTIADILPDGFPTSKETGWVTDNGGTCYFSGSNLTFKSASGQYWVNVAAGKSLSLVGSDYIYSDTYKKVTFKMSGAVLQSITFEDLSGGASSFAVGEYKPGPVAKILETGLTYETVQKAVNAAAKDQTVQMLADSAENITVEPWKNLTLDLNGKTLTGNGTQSVIKVSGTLTLKDGGDGGKITGNTSTGKGGGVRVFSEGSFIMNSGTITGISAQYGGGVYNEGSFIMNSGVITGNIASDPDHGVGAGGGVDNEGVFTMNGGTISGNTALNSGGGVFSYGSFTMNGGTITGNSAPYGGGVSVDGEFIMNGGNIVGNTAESYGGGVYISDGKFTMDGGNITNNTAKQGGGVFNFGSSGTFVMSGGAITGNNATANGGGVNNRGTFVMSGGAITGNNANQGGGVYFANGNVTLGGTAKITGNTKSDGTTKSNLYLPDGKTVTIGTDDKAPITTGETVMQVGVTMQTPGKFTTNGTADDAKWFTSDNADYEVIFNTDHLELAEINYAELITDALTGKSNQSVPGVVEVAVDDTVGIRTVKLLKTVDLGNKDITVAENVFLDLNHFSLITTGKLTNNGVITLHQENADIVEDLLYEVPGNYSTDEELKLPNDASPEYVIPAKAFMTSEVGTNPAYQELSFASGDDMLVWNKDVTAGVQIDVAYSLALGGNILGAKGDNVKPTKVTAINFALNNNIAIGGNNGEGEASLVVESIPADDLFPETVGTFTANGKKITLNKSGKLVIFSNITFDESVLVSGVNGMTVAKTENKTDGTVTYFLETPHTHKSIKVDGKVATTKEAGFKSYYKCDCGKFFEDTTCKVEITDLDAWKAQGGAGYIAKLEEDPTSPQTGDTSDMTLWIMLMTLSSMGLCACLVLGKKRKNEQ